MKLRTDQKFTMYDESYLYDCMGLTKTTSKELSSVLDPKITSFLQKNQLVKADPNHKRHAAAVKAAAVSKADYFNKEAKVVESDVTFTDRVQTATKMTKHVDADPKLHSKAQQYQQQNQ